MFELDALPDEAPAAPNTQTFIWTVPTTLHIPVAIPAGMTVMPRLIIADLERTLVTAANLWASYTFPLKGTP